MDCPFQWDGAQGISAQGISRSRKCTHALFTTTTSAHPTKGMTSSHSIRAVAVHQVR
jgi:hypothetical protein